MNEKFNMFNINGHVLCLDLCQIKQNQLFYVLLTRVVLQESILILGFKSSYVPFISSVIRNKEMSLSAGSVTVTY